MKKLLMVLAVAMVLPACAQLQAVGLGLSGAVTAVKETRYKIAEKAEVLRCKRSVELVLRMADARGDEWFISYLRSCPNMESYLRRIATILQPRPMLPPVDGRPVPVIVVAPVEVVN